MTFGTGLTTVVTSIAGLTVSGVAMKGTDGIPPSGSMVCPIFFPQPNGFVSDLSVVRTTFGINGAGRLDVTYALNYVYLHAPVGGSLGTFELYAGMVTNLAAILNAIMSNDTISGAADIKPGGIADMGVVADPAGKEYWGTLLVINVLEYVQP